jgi:hypothetical protein
MVPSIWYVVTSTWWQECQYSMPWIIKAIRRYRLSKPDVLIYRPKYRCIGDNIGLMTCHRCQHPRKSAPSILTNRYINIYHQHRHFKTSLKSTSTKFTWSLALIYEHNLTTSTDNTRLKLWSSHTEWRLNACFAALLHLSGTRASSFFTWWGARLLV